MTVVFGYLLLINLVAFAVFLIDKRQARRGGYRLSERALLGLSLLGGSLGAFAAMRIARHKTSKLSFRVPFQATVALQIAGLCTLTFWPQQAAVAASRLLG